MPFFYNNKGDVGRPSRWSVGHREDSWRGGFLLSALELYLKIDMKAKFQFLADLEAAIGFTSTLMTQNNWGNDKNEGLTTMVPQVAFQDYFKVIDSDSCSHKRTSFDFVSDTANTTSLWTCYARHSSSQTRLSTTFTGSYRAARLRRGRRLPS